MSRLILLPIVLIVLIGFGRPLIAADRPNILLVVTSDQGYGDLGAHGNPILKTPHLDAFTHESVHLKQFYASPVGAQTRASLLTGLHSYRTGVVALSLGRSLMRPDIRTLPERLRQVGYRTGHFGKWNLGDNYPLRPEDRGFDSTLWHRGAGLAQVADHPDSDAKTAYFDPYLVQNGRDVRAKGYCTDVFTDAALEFLAEPSKKPFFAYVAYNAIHEPYQVPDADAEPYREQKLTADSFPKIGQDWAGQGFDAAKIANAYGMLTNLDRNFGRLLDSLEKSGQAANTIVIVMSDNGVGGVRFNSGLRYPKGTVYEGGLRVPCYWRWPAEFKPGVVEQPLTAVDIAPTLLRAAEVTATTAKQPLDGWNLLPLLKSPKSPWPERPLVFQFHRTDVPQRYRAFAIRKGPYKLTQAIGVNPVLNFTPKFELYNIATDPYETTDLSEKQPELVAKLMAEYDTWFSDVTKAGFDPVRIHVGNPKENPVRLSRQDWRGERASWPVGAVGHWELFVERAGTYRITMESRTPFTAVTISTNGKELQIANERAESTRTKTVSLELPAGKLTLQCVLQNGLKSWGAEYVEVEGQP